MSITRITRGVVIGAVLLSLSGWVLTNVAIAV